MHEPRWRHPLNQLAAARSELDRRVHHLRDRVAGEEAPVTAGAWCPALDVEDTADAVLLHAELPGVGAEDVEVSVDGRTLLIRGDRAFYPDRAQEGFRRIERAFGRFDRRVRLPADADVDQIDAAFEHGVLTVTVPKLAAARRTRVEVTRADSG